MRTWKCCLCSSTNVYFTNIKILSWHCFHAFLCAHNFFCFNVESSWNWGAHYKQQLNSTCRVPIVLTTQLKWGNLNIYDHVHTHSGSDNRDMTVAWLTLTSKFRDVTLWKKYVLESTKCVCFFCFVCLCVCLNLESILRMKSTQKHWVLGPIPDTLSVFSFFDCLHRMSFNSFPSDPTPVSGFSWILGVSPKAQIPAFPLRAMWL